MSGSRFAEVNRATVHIEFREVVARSHDQFACTGLSQNAIRSRLLHSIVKRQRNSRRHFDCSAIGAQTNRVRTRHRLAYGQRTAVHRNHVAGTAKCAIFHAVAIGQRRDGHLAAVQHCRTGIFIGIVDGHVARAVEGERGVAADGTSAERIVL